MTESDDDKRARAVAHLDRGFELLEAENGTVAEALVEWRAAAALGLGEAMFNIGHAYARGKGVAKDVAEAHEWFKRAAAAGSFQGMNNLAFNFAEGVPAAGVAPDLAEAQRLWRTAAEGGLADAMYNLGTCLGKLDENDPEQVVWFRRAIENGHDGAMNGLGLCHSLGKGGVKKNAVVACAWFRKAAECGEPVAMLNLARCYVKGEGVEMNAHKALHWSECAVQAGLAEAAAQVTLVKALIVLERQCGVSSPTATTKSPCAACGVSANNRCSGCLYQFYCSVECQRAHWHEHKAECRAKRKK